MWLTGPDNSISSTLHLQACHVSIYSRGLGSVQCCVLYNVHISGYGYTSQFSSFTIEVIYNSGPCVPAPHHQNYLHRRSQMLYGLGSSLLWFLISEPVQTLFMMCGVPHQSQHLTVYFISDPLKQIVVIKFRNTFRALLAPSRKIPGHWCLIWSRRYLKSDLLGPVWSHTSDKTAAPQQKSIPQHRWSPPPPTPQ